MNQEKLEERDFETNHGVKICSIRAYLLREVPNHPDKKLLMQSYCYSQCNSSCPRNPDYGRYI